METITRVFHGRLVNPGSVFGKLEIVSNGTVGIAKSGRIAFLDKGEHSLNQLQEKFGFAFSIVSYLHHKILVPGLVDTHIHGPQYINGGKGTNLPLLEWLETYTFPSETRLKNVDIAANVYDKVVERTLRNGTTTAMYFATIHLEASKKFVEILESQGQRAFVGKVNMDRNSPNYYVETTKDSIKDTEEFIKWVNARENPLVAAVITPRFVPSCTPELMEALGNLAEKYNAPIQSHISENPSEVQWIKELHPDCGSYAEVYDKYKLMTSKTVMAHAVHCSDAELELFAKRGSGISHCPVSNFTLGSGVFHLRHAQDMGVDVGLGTDVSGGYSCSMWEVMRQTMIASRVVSMQARDGNKHESEPNKNFGQLEYDEAFWLATMGGAKILGLQDKIGNFDPGKDFDALILDPLASGSNFDTFDSDTLSEIFQKIVFLGDDRNVSEVYVQGIRVIGRIDRWG